jgi:hypothetical protein
MHLFGRQAVGYGVICVSSRLEICKAKREGLEGGVAVSEDSQISRQYATQRGASCLIEGQCVSNGE